MEALIRFFYEVGKLKFIKRVGWMFGGVKEADTESIADHSFRLAIMSWFFAEKKGLDVTKVIKMSLIHDLCTIYSGDLTPYDNLVTGDFKKDQVIVSKWPRRAKEEKEALVKLRRQKEEEALDKLLKGLSQDMASEIKHLWNDYESGNSKEGRFVAQIDRVEKLLQSTEYKSENKYKADIDPFWVQLKELVDDPDIIHFIEELDSFYFKTSKKNGKNTYEKHNLTSQ